VVGWRRDRVPERPTGRPVSDAARLGLRSALADQRQARSRRQVPGAPSNGAPHHWIVDPLEHTLIVDRWEPRGYLVVLTAGNGGTVRAEPFEQVELRVAALFGLEADDE
jgi:hypothetical protein